MYRLSVRSLICLLAFLWVAAASFAVEPDPEALTPELSELESFYFTPRSPLAPTPEAPSWLDVSKEESASLQWQQPVASVGGLRKFDMSRPPRKTYWWNYPLYGLLGFPKDLVDGFYGVVGKVPPFNLMITGLTYEVVPMQLLVRKYKDWHKWPGRANKHGHGWVTAPNGWGFFPNYHFTKFRPLNEKKLTAWEQHNAWVDQEVAKKNEQIAKANEEVTKRRQAHLAAAQRLYERRQYRETVAKLWVYLEADPRHRQARAMLIASLVAVLPNLAERDWAEGVIARHLRTCPQAVLVAVKEELTRIGERNPDREEVPYYLVWVNTHLRAFGAAHKAARRLASDDPANVKWRRLQFETALRSEAPEWIDPAVRVLEDLTGAGSVASRHARGRVAFQREHYATAREIYRGLSEEHPNRARFHYLYGMAEMREGMKTGIYSRTLAVRALKRAVETTGRSGERIVYEKALRAARVLRVERPEE